MNDLKSLGFRVRATEEEDQVALQPPHRPYTRPVSLTLYQYRVLPLVLVARLQADGETNVIYRQPDRLGHIIVGDPLRFCITKQLDIRYNHFERRQHQLFKWHH